MSLPVTQHFSVGEFACHDGTPYPQEWLQERLLPLCRVLEAIRTACGNRHIEIVSGFRTVPYNARIGGAAHSQHCQGTAADVRVDGLPPSEVYAAAMALFKAGEIEALGGAGQYTGWCHFDVRKRPADGHLAVWTGNGVGSEVA